MNSPCGREVLLFVLDLSPGLEFLSTALSISTSLLTVIWKWMHFGRYTITASLLLNMVMACGTWILDIRSTAKKKKFGCLRPSACMVVARRGFINLKMLEPCLEHFSLSITVVINGVYRHWHEVLLDSGWASPACTTRLATSFSACSREIFDQCSQIFFDWLHSDYSVFEWIGRLLLKRFTRFDSRSSQTKNYKNWYSQLSFLTFSNQKIQCEASVECDRQVGIRRQFDLKTEKVISLPPGQGRLVNKDVNTIH